MRIRILAISVFLILLPVLLRAGSVIPASDKRLVYVGRTLVEGGDVSFDWSSTYVRVSFTGNSLGLRASDTRRDIFNVWLDREMSAEPDKVISISSDTLLSLVVPDEVKTGKLKGKIHTVIIQKRTEGDQGTATFHEFLTSGEFTQANAMRPRVLEFVGDSYTCGYGSENSIPSQRYSPETQNPSKTYAAILARYFDADFITIAHSGQGVSRNYDDGDRRTHMPDRYGRTIDKNPQIKWTQTEMPRPALTVVYLGTNDFSTDRQPMRDVFKKDYIRLISQIKEYWGLDHPVLCVSSKVDPILFEYVREVVEDCGYQRVYYTGFFNGIHQDNDQELGADWHPNYAAHRKLAYSLIPYVSTITGWPLDSRPVE